MAVSTWFNSWNPPHNLFPDHQTTFHAPIHMTNFTQNINHQHYHPKSARYNQPPTSSFSTLFPFILQLGLQSPPAAPPETTGPFRTVYSWSTLDFAFPSESARQAAIESGDFIPRNNLPLGVEVYKDRLFVSMPKWKNGVPATLAVLPKIPIESSPALVPYPSWSLHTDESCDGLTSVFRMQADTCGRLWVLDSGQIDVTIQAKQVCPPQIFVFDLESDELILKYELPAEFIKQDSLYSNIVVDIRDNNCNDVHVYLTDVWRFGIVVFSLKRMKSWRITDHLFYPEPLAAAYNVQGLEFEWTDGIFGISLAPYNKVKKDRIIYFHPMSSFREFFSHASIVCNETGWRDVKDAFQVMGQSRGKSGQASAAAMDRNGIMFYNLVTRDAVGCWDSRKPYKRENLGVVAKSEETLVFPNDLKIDNEKRQSLWVLSNRLPFYLYKELNSQDINFRIMTARVDEAIQGTICDPRVGRHDTFVKFPDEQEDCY